MPFDAADCEAALSLAKSLSPKEAPSPRERVGILAKFLEKGGFKPLAASLAADMGDVPSLAMGAGAPSAGAEKGDCALAAVFAPSLSAVDDEDVWNLAAFAALAVAYSKAGKGPVAFVSTTEDSQGGQAQWRSLLEAVPSLKAAKLVLTPSPVRPFPLNDLTVFPLAFAFKGRASMKLTAAVADACADCPDAKNAAGRLNRALIRIANQKLPNQVTVAAKTMFFGLRRAGGPFLPLAMAGMTPTLAGMALEGGLDGSPLNVHVAAATRNTVCPVAMGADEPTLEHPVPLNAWASLDVRHLPGTDVRGVMFQLREILDDEALTILPGASVPPMVSPTDTPLFQSLMKSIASQGLSVRMVPWLSPRAPDALVLAASSGAAAYGLPMVGNPSGDDLESTAWVKSLAALEAGLEG